MNESENNEIWIETIESNNFDISVSNTFFGLCEYYYSRKEHGPLPQIGWHVAPALCRESISNAGLFNELCDIEIWANCDDWDDGTYVWDTLEAAQIYKKENFPVPSDIYRVDLSDLELFPDITVDGKSVLDGAWFTPGVILPGRLQMEHSFADEACIAVSAALAEKYLLRGLNTEAAGAPWVFESIGAGHRQKEADQVLLRVDLCSDMDIDYVHLNAESFFSMGFAWKHYEPIPAAKISRS